MSELPLRPHHGMCLAFFEGRGYSEDFAAHMERVARLLNRKDPAVELVIAPDAICSRCPNNAGGVCASAEKAERYDRAVLDLCGLPPGAAPRWSEFSALVRRQVLSPGLRRRVCGDCCWDGLCDSRERGENQTAKAGNG